MNTEIYRPGETILIEELKQIVRSARSKVYAAINQTMVEAYWQIGKRIVEEVDNSIYAFLKNSPHRGEF